jgi:CRISPR system Cascade subunit CasE
VQVFVQSQAVPRWAIESRDIRAEGPLAMDGFLARFEAGGRYRFRLHANPTRRVHARSAEGPDLRPGVHPRDRSEKPGAVGKRVAVRDEEARLAWLHRKGTDAGFTLAAARVAPGIDSKPEAYQGFSATREEPAGMRYGRQPAADRGIALETCTFEGVLEVADADALRAAILSGVGPGKAFGCGLLSLAAV